MNGKQILFDIVLALVHLGLVLTLYAFPLAYLTDAIVFFTSGIFYGYLIGRGRRRKP